MVRAAAIAAASVTRKKSNDSSRSVFNSGAIVSLLCAETIIYKDCRLELSGLQESAAIVSESSSG
jgi:hypothetical protein